MCAYTTFLIVFKAAVSGLGQGDGAARAFSRADSLRALVVGCAARKIEDQSSEQQKSQHILAGLFDSAKQFRVLVAGAGFEPTTFGL